MVADAHLLPALIGSTQPRIAPPVPVNSLIDEYEAAAAELGITLMPWQKVAARYITAVNDDGSWRYREVCIVVARQNGKTTLLLPRILMALSSGQRVLHTAQDRALPKLLFEDLAALVVRDKRLARISWTNGTEQIRFNNGGRYILVAPRHGVRGHSADVVLQDEVREQRDDTLKRAMLPTTTFSSNPQTIYLSNAGDDESVVLNDLRRRMENGDERLAYLEWSAAPERAVDDREGWREANPALGHKPSVYENLETAFAAFHENLAGFETEHLCRWVTSMQPRLVSDAAWVACRTEIAEKPERPYIGISMAPDGTRASASMAWQMGDGRIALVELKEAEGHPIDVPRLGADLKAEAMKYSAKAVGFASWTDADLSHYLSRAKPIDGKEFCAASEKFARLVLSGQLAWDGAEHVTNDLAWTARKPHEVSGAWMAVPASPERSIPSVLAAIRAVWLASAPRPPVPRIG